MTNKASLRDLVDALRSGDYQKGRAALKTRKADDTVFSYCCEGVMCEISGVPEISREHDEYGKLVIGFRSDFGTEHVTSFAPASVWAGSGIETQSNGDVAMIKLPQYYVEDMEFIDGKKVFHLSGGYWSLQSLASLNDYMGAEPGNTFTFDQIADLIEWAYLTD